LGQLILIITSFSNIFHLRRTVSEDKMGKREIFELGQVVSSSHVVE
jgi:hypothetical protein